MVDVRDTGLGNELARFQTSAQDQGYGLSQVRERLLTVYGSQAQMEINSKAGEGTQVRLQWPLQ